MAQRVEATAGKLKWTRADGSWHASGHTPEPVRSYHVYQDDRSFQATVRDGGRTYNLGVHKSAQAAKDAAEEYEKRYRQQAAAPAVTECATCPPEVTQAKSCMPNADSLIRQAETKLTYQESEATVHAWLQGQGCDPDQAFLILAAAKILAADVAQVGIESTVPTSAVQPQSVGEPMGADLGLNDPCGPCAQEIIARDFNSADDALAHAATHGFTHYIKHDRKIVVYGPGADDTTTSARMYRHKGKYHFSAPVLSKQAMPKRAKPLPSVASAPAAPDHRVVRAEVYRSVSYKVFQDFQYQDGTYSVVIEGGAHNGGAGWHQDGHKTIEDAEAAVKASIDAYPEHYGAGPSTAMVVASPTAIVSRSAIAEDRHYDDFRWDVPLDEQNAGRWVEAPLLGTWLGAWYQAPAEGGGYWVQFDPDSPFRRVKEIREIGAQLDPWGQPMPSKPAAPPEEVTDSMRAAVMARLIKAGGELPVEQVSDQDRAILATVAPEYIEADGENFKITNRGRKWLGTRKKAHAWAAARENDDVSCFPPPIPLWQHPECTPSNPAQYAMEAGRLPGLTFVRHSSSLSDSSGQWRATFVDARGYRIEGVNDVQAFPFVDYFVEGRNLTYIVGAVVAADANARDQRFVGTYQEGSFPPGTNTPGGAVEPTSWDDNRLMHEASRILMQMLRDKNWKNKSGVESSDDDYAYEPSRAGSMTLAQLRGLPYEHWRAQPPIHQGHFDNLVYDDGRYRVWVSRMTLADYDGDKQAWMRERLHFEQLRNGQWVDAGSVANGHALNEAPRRMSATNDFLRWMSGWEVTEEPGDDWLVAYRLAAVQGERPGESVLFMRQESRIWHAFFRDGMAGSGTTPAAALEGGVFNEHVRGRKVEGYCSKVTGAPAGLEEQYPALAKAQRRCEGEGTRRTARPWQMGAPQARERGLVWLQRHDGIYWANATGGTFWLMPQPSGGYQTTWMAVGGDQQDLGMHPLAEAMQVAQRFDPTSKRQAAESHRQEPTEAQLEWLEHIARREALRASGQDPYAYLRPEEMDKRVLDGLVSRRWAEIRTFRSKVPGKNFQYVTITSAGHAVLHAAGHHEDVASEAPRAGHHWYRVTYVDTSRPRSKPQTWDVHARDRQHAQALFNERALPSWELLRINHSPIEHNSRPYTRPVAEAGHGTFRYRAIHYDVYASDGGYRYVLHFPESPPTLGPVVADYTQAADAARTAIDEHEDAFAFRQEEVEPEPEPEYEPHLPPMMPPAPHPLPQLPPGAYPSPAFRAAEAARRPPFAEAPPGTRGRRHLPVINYAVIVGPANDKDTLRIRQFLSRSGQSFKFYDTETDPDAKQLIEEYRIRADALPSVIWKDIVLTRPSNRKLADVIGFGTRVEGDQSYDVVIVGAGPAGLSAAVYAASEGLTCAVVEMYAPGGQAANSSKIENYAGFPQGISGADLAALTYNQALKFGAHFIIPADAKRLLKNSSGFEVRMSDNSRVHGKTVILACGLQWKKPEYQNLPKFEGVGVYYAATATEASYVKSQDVAVVGGGNSAGQAAMYLSGIARKVSLIVRKSGLADTMSHYLVERIEHTKNIELLPFTEITKLEGGAHLESVTWDQAGKTRTEPVRHVFLMIGSVPNTDWVSQCTPSSKWVEDCVALDFAGYIKTGAEDLRDVWKRGEHGRDPFPFETSMAWCFAAGDIRLGSTKRVATAVGEGAVAVGSVHKALYERAHRHAAE